MFECKKEKKKKKKVGVKLNEILQFNQIWKLTDLLGMEWVIFGIW